MCIVDDLHASVKYLVIADTGAEVKEDSRLVTSECVFVKSRSVCGCKTYLYTIVGELYRIEAWLYLLQLMVETCVDVLCVVAS